MEEIEQYLNAQGFEIEEAYDPDGYSDEIYYCKFFRDVWFAYYAWGSVAYIDAETHKTCNTLDELRAFYLTNPNYIELPITTPFANKKVC